MSILEVRQFCHAYGDKILYDEADLDLYRGEHLGLVGQNGAGKSTFLSAIIGETQPDGAKIKWHPKIKIGYLDQHLKINLEQTIDQYLKSAFVELFAIEQRLEKNLQRLNQKYEEKILNKILNDQELLEERNFVKISSRVGKVSKGLGLNVLGMERKLAELSGGQRAKVILAKLLLDEPNILLLDEPTNFLDKEHVSWLTLYLKNYPEAFILISHDQHFLDEVTTHIAHVDHGQITKYRGNYSAFLKQKEMQDDEKLRLYRAQKKEIDKAKDYIARNGARASTAAQAQSRQKKLDKMVLVQTAQKEVKPHFNFLEKPQALGKMLEVVELEIGYEQALLPPLSFSLEAGKKVVITGFNGIGKSTLLKTLIGEIPALSGEFEFSYQSELGYFAQDFLWMDKLMSPLDVIGSQFPTLDQQQIRGMLARYAIKAEHVLQPVVSLSGGEQAKVKMCLIALRPSNFLILDEPTNHLDSLAKESLREALEKFSGGVILVSHEHNFYRDWVDEVLSIENLSG